MDYPICPWLETPFAAPSAVLRVFALPYAGGTAYMYRAWQKELPVGVQLCPIQLPGRGRRLKEQPYTRMEDLVPALSQALLPCLDVPFAFIGHSMGGIIGFEVARYLQEKYQRTAKMLIVSGCTPAHTLHYERVLYNLPDKELIAELRAYGGSPEEVLKNDEIMNVLLPMMRSDLQLIQTYIHHPGPLLRGSIHAIAGLDDPGDTPDSMARWADLTTGGYSLNKLPGAHFFIFTAHSLFMQLLDALLTPHLSETSGLR